MFVKFIFIAIFCALTANQAHAHNDISEDIIKTAEAVTFTVCSNKKTTGSAVHIGQGLFVTANHVTAKKNLNLCNQALGTPIKLILKARDKKTDIAILQADISDEEWLFAPFNHAKIAEDKLLIPGENLLIIGSSAGFENVIRFGNLASRIPQNQTWGFMMISTYTNPGDSGGGIFDKNGELVGIHLARSPKLNGLAFAREISAVKLLFEKLKRGEKCL